MTDKQLSLEDIAHYPRPGMDIPGHVSFTPDSQQVVYVAGVPGSLVRELWSYNLASEERQQLTKLAGHEVESARPQTRSLNEELQRERSRQRESGVSTYQFAQAAASGSLLLLVPYNGQLFLAHGSENLTPLPGCEGASDARLSPDGSRVAFVHAGEILVAPTDGSGQPRALTSGATDEITHGLADYIAQEEMDRLEGYWWHPAGTHLAFVRVDSRHIPPYPIVHQGTEQVAIEEYRFPFPGARNVAVQLGVVAVDGSAEVTWMDLGADDDIYLARVAWRPDGVLTALIQSRDQRTQRLVAFDTRSGAASTLIEEHGYPWLNLHDDLRFLRSGEMLWSSERTGFRHLSLHARDGQEIRTLTSGQWMVTGQVTVDEERRLVYFQATHEGPTERHLYVVSLDGGSPWCLTQEPSWHDAVISPDRRFLVETWQSPEQAPRLTLRKLEDGKVQAVLFAAEDLTPGLTWPLRTGDHQLPHQRRCPALRRDLRVCADAFRWSAASAGCGRLRRSMGTDRDQQLVAHRRSAGTIPGSTRLCGPES